MDRQDTLGSQLPACLRARQKPQNSVNVDGITFQQQKVGNIFWNSIGVPPLFFYHPAGLLHRIMAIRGRHRSSAFSRHRSAKKTIDPTHLAQLMPPRHQAAHSTKAAQGGLSVSATMAFSQVFCLSHRGTSETASLDFLVVVETPEDP